jgi:predicted acylesterase/phospholipase RssA
MSIKHLVICGGGPLGFSFLGAIEKLNEEKFFELHDIESIYGTSIGSIIGAFICLKYDWETLVKYVIERPWHDAIKVTAKQIFDSYYNKGLFNKKVAEIIFKPLLEAKELSINVTLKEFYEYSKIDLHIFTFEMNKFETVELSHTTHPTLGLLEALTMSSSLPGIFMPIIQDDKCYLDGGVMCNFPLNECIRDHPNKDEILGIKIYYNKGNCSNLIVTPDSSLLEYIICLSVNSMNFIRESVKLEHIDNIIKCNVDDNPLSLDFMTRAINNKEVRRELYKKGHEFALEFLLLKRKPIGS